MGDGGINNNWQANITVNTVADAEYVPYLSRLCLELFGVEPAVRMRKGKKATIISLASTSVVDFLVDHGLPRGNKIAQGLSIPKWILSKPSYKKACMRGLMDTDGCLYVHKHIVAKKEYRNIGLCFSSHSPQLIIEVIEIFEEFGIVPHIGKQGRAVYLYQAEAVAKYLRVFGTSNPRISNVYKNWKRG